MPRSGLIMLVMSLLSVLCRWSQLPASSMMSHTAAQAKKDMGPISILEWSESTVINSSKPTAALVIHGFVQKWRVPYTQFHGYFNGRSLINHGMCFQGNWPRNFTFSGSFIISWPKKDHCGRANPSRSSYQISHLCMHWKVWWGIWKKSRP